MKIDGNLIKAWVYKKSLFYLVKLKGQNEPVVLSARELKSFNLNNNGKCSGSMDYNKFKIAQGSSKQYFGNKEASKPVDQNEGFDEYDPFYEDTFLSAPDDDIDLLGYQTPLQTEGGYAPSGPSGSVIPTEPSVPPPSAPLPPPPPSPLTIYRELTGSGVQKDIE